MARRGMYCHRNMVKEKEKGAYCERKVGIESDECLLAASSLASKKWRIGVGDESLRTTMSRMGLKLNGKSWVNGETMLCYTHHTL